MIDQDKLIQLYADVEVLKCETAALRHIAMVLATRLCELNPESAQRTQSLLAILVPYADHAEQPPSGGMVRAFLQSVLALTENGADPAAALALRALLAKDAGADRLDALDEWHSQATEDEIAQDIQQLLAKLRSPSGSGPAE
ncbi:hypothetical protein L3X14_16965 [Pseudomonas balearica]|uniref:hypothetical protein n=1 Tax=Stutzerimonas balearica TaxID=74829 RepID=UPI001F32D924|nr:hypothetical protein [Stutzerimonas balearica]MCF6758271.1 hypothetical protein [Stutzerimonas balearica]